MNRQSKRLGFSLVELVIVIVIIGVIAAVAVPRISRGAKGADLAALRASLAGMRNAIDMYAAEHGGAFPTGATQIAIEDVMVKKTDSNGIVSATGEFGPYLRSGFPPAPVGVNKGSRVIIITTGDPVPTAATEGTGEGWIYSTDTGKIVVNSIGNDGKTPPINYTAY